MRALTRLKHSNKWNKWMTELRQNIVNYPHGTAIFQFPQRRDSGISFYLLDMQWNSTGLDLIWDSLGLCDVGPAMFHTLKELHRVCPFVSHYCSHRPMRITAVYGQHHSRTKLTETFAYTVFVRFGKFRDMPSAEFRASDIYRLSTVVSEAFRRFYISARHKN